MDDILHGVYQSHRLLLVLAALGYFAYWTRTRFWLPRYAHVMAAVSVLLGVAVLLMTPPEAPVNSEPLGWVKKGAMLAVFPAMVYFFFIFYGGQRAAYDHLHGEESVACANCGTARESGDACPACGHP